MRPHRPIRSRLLAPLTVALAALLLAPALAQAAPMPTIRHVFVIVLENKDYDVTFGPDSPAPYLAEELPAQGQLLTEYYGIGHLSLTNYIAMVSGQAPNPQTQSDCQYYTDFLPGTMGPDGQAIGQGCVYPDTVKTVADQLTDAGLTWKGYMQDMGDRDGESETCAHPDLNTQDNTQSASAESQYAARHNPFVYFHSIIDSPDCATNDVPLDRLASDLETIDTTANYSFITPDLCHDAHDETCADGGKGGLAAANDFLKTWVPKILASPAYKKDGLLVVTFDEAEVSQGQDDAAACCNEQPGPNSPLPGIYGMGGGRVGAVLLSPFVAPGTTNDTPYNHYSLLRSVEDIFGLDHLGYAGQDGLKPFGDDVFASRGETAAGGAAAGTPSGPSSGAAPATPAPAQAAAVALPSTGGGSGAAAVGALLVLAATGLATRRRRVTYGVR